MRRVQIRLFFLIFVSNRYPEWRLGPEVVHLLRDHGPMTPARVRWMLSLDDEDKERFSAAVDALVLANVLMRFEDKLAAPSWDVASEYLEKHRVHPSHLAGNIRRGERAYRERLDRLAEAAPPDPILSLAHTLAANLS